MKAIFNSTVAKMADRKGFKLVIERLNLRSRVKENQNLSILFLERQSIQPSKTGKNLT